MEVRKKGDKAPKAKANYFTGEKTNHQFISSGCTLLNQALGGGWPCGRVSNIVGDKSTSKTALATEAVTNFMRQFPKGHAAYRDTESSYDEAYARQMGLPEGVDFGESRLSTIEEFHDDLVEFVGSCKKQPGIYVVDSLDALSDAAEMERQIGDTNTYGTQKAKKLSELFRKVNSKVEASKVHLMIISQVRDNIGAMMGEKHKRSGGRALDFYASQVVWLAHLGRLDKQIKGVKRPYGIKVRAKVAKNKVGLPFRQVDFEFWFGYGIEDLVTSVLWLGEVDRLKDVNLSKSDLKGYLKAVHDMDPEQYLREHDLVTVAAKKAWVEIDTAFMPKRVKYG